MNLTLLAPKFWRHVCQSAGCWQWLGNKSGRGYGRIQYPGGSVAAHRVSVALHGKPILPGMVADHICKNRLCVNPAHIHEVDPKTNTLENSLAPTAINAKKTYCKRGHPLSGENLFMDYRNRRRCRQCQRIHDNAYKQRKSAALAQKRKP